VLGDVLVGGVNRNVAGTAQERAVLVADDVHRVHLADIAVGLLRGGLEGNAFVLLNDGVGRVNAAKGGRAAREYA